MISLQNLTYKVAVRSKEGATLYSIEKKQNPRNIQLDGEDYNKEYRGGVLVEGIKTSLTQSWTEKAIRMMSHCITLEGIKTPLT